MTPGRAVAQVRAAVRTATADLSGSGALVLAACSGGADSLALAAALAGVGPASGLRIGVVHVDHGLHPDSGSWSAGVERWAAGAGVTCVETLRVRVGSSGGPEAAARTARYAALEEAATRLGAAAVLLGHTRDDQAETLLLGLARGSGARSLAGMPGRRGLYRRPLLDLERATTRAACSALGLHPVDDPANLDLASARVRVRTHALPALEAALGPGVAASLARTASMLRADADALDEQAAAVYDRLASPDGLDTAALGALAPAVRTRVLRLHALRAGSPGGALSARHVAALDVLVTGWRGQGPVSLPGGLEAVRRSGRLTVAPGPRSGRGTPSPTPQVPATPE